MEMIKNKRVITTFVAIMMILMCCPLVALAANTTEEVTTETVTTEEETFSEEDESSKEILEELFDAFERSYGIKLSCNVYEDQQELLKELEVPDKDNEVILWTVRNKEIFKVTSSSNVSIEGLTKILEKVKLEGKEWGDWIAELAIEMTSFDYKVKEPSIKEKLVKSTEGLAWIIVLLMLVYIGYLKYFSKKEKRPETQVKKSRKVRKAEEGADFLEIEVRKKTAELELCKLHKKLKKYEEPTDNSSVINPQESRTEEAKNEET